MRGDQRIVLRLEVDRDANPITGTLSQAGRAQQAFTGWLAFSEVIESIRAAEPADGRADAAGLRASTKSD